MDRQSEWVSITLKNGELYEGTVESEAVYGIYLYINGVLSKLILLTWDTVEKIIRKT